MVNMNNPRIQNFKKSKFKPLRKAFLVKLTEPMNPLSLSFRSVNYKK